MRSLSLGLTSLIMFGISTAAAHQPATSDNFEFDVAKPKISWALVGSFDAGDEVFTVYLDYDEPFALPFEMLTEHRTKFADFRPAYAIVGPGFPAPSDADIAFLPRELPADAGVFIERNDGEREAIFESVMRRAYYSSGAIALPLLAGKYEVWVWSPDGDTGDFTLGLGVEEDFSDGGFDKLAANWSDYAY